MNKTISISELKRIVTESNDTLDNFKITDDVIDELLEMGGDEIEQRTERLVREIALDALKKALITVKGGDFEEEVGQNGLVRIRISALATPLFKNAKDLIRVSTDEENDSIDITDGIPSEDEYLAEKSSFGDPDEDDYVYEPDPSGELDLNGNPKMIKRAKGFGDDWKRVKGKVKGWFSRR